MMVSVGGGGVETAPAVKAMLSSSSFSSALLDPPSSMRKLIGAGSHLLPRMKWWPRRPRCARSNYMEANWNCYPSLPPACLVAA